MRNRKLSDVLGSGRKMYNLATRFQLGSVRTGEFDIPRISANVLFP